MLNKKEIGSEFWQAELDFECRVERNTYLSGRTALSAIILDLKKRGISSVCLPDYCCESMIEPFIRQNMDIGFYSVSSDGKGLCFALDEASAFDAVMLVNYFGFMSKEMIELIKICKNAGKTILLDLTHAVFAEESIFKSDYIFGSYRKWTGIEVGFASKQDHSELISWQCNDIGIQYLQLRKQARKIKKAFIKGGYSDELQRDEQLDYFKKAEDLLDHEYISDTDEENRRLLRSLDIKFIKEQRRKNAKVIYDSLRWIKSCIPLFATLEEDMTPLAIPILVDEGRRDSLHRFLQKNGVFCPIHWPLSSMHWVGEGAFEIYRKEISLVCDQRYEEKDMARMMEMIKQWEITTSK